MFSFLRKVLELLECHHWHSKSFLSMHIDGVIIKSGSKMTTTITKDHAPFTITANFFDTAGADITNRSPIAWASSDTGIVSVDSAGQTVNATLGASGSATVSATFEGLTITTDFIVTEVVLPVASGTLTVNL